MTDCAHHWLITEQITKKVVEEDYVQSWRQEFVHAECQKCGAKQASPLTLKSGESFEHSVTLGVDEKLCKLESEFPDV